MSKPANTSLKNARSALAAAADLRAVIQGEVLLPGDGGYARARQIWNRAVDHRPALFAVCETVEDVQVAVRTSRAHSLPLSVRGGGHDWAGRALRQDGLVIDLSRLRLVEVNPQTRVAKVGGGATAADLITAATPHGLGAVTGTAGTAGMVGLTLGGGYGPLTSRYGLALDNLLGAEVVLANGQLVTADTSENAELFWALRGGGGNFGVVVSMGVRLHPVGKLLAGFILFPWSEAKSVLRGFAEMVRFAPDELAVTAGVLSDPEGEPILFLAPTWSGQPEQGKQVITELERLGTPILVQIGPMGCSDLLSQYEAQLTNGRHYTVKTRWLPELTPEVISLLLAGASNRTSSFNRTPPFTLIALQHFHGAPTRVPLEATAFGLRREHFLAKILAAWETSTQVDSANHRQWAQNLSSALDSAALPGGYPNLLGPEECERIAGAYGRNLTRLQDVKRRFDPESIFCATSLPA
jgi:FAD binding domain/Berberine and berberine like